MRFSTLNVHLRIILQLPDKNFAYNFDVQNEKNHVSNLLAELFQAFL